MPFQPIAYTVIAKHPSPASAGAYANWLAGGHIRAVLAGGAQSAQVVRLDWGEGEPQGGPVVVEVRYVFASRDALERYFKEFAPALRAEGLARFGPSTGVVFERTTGVVMHREGV